MRRLKKVQERRFQERISDKSVLMIEGKDSAGISFHETSQINDVSPEGISFFLGRAVTMDQLLTLTIGEMEEASGVFVSSYTVKARVLNVTPPLGTASKYRVGARFEGEAKELEDAFRPEAFAKQLREAIQSDEHRKELN